MLLPLQGASHVRSCPVVFCIACPDLLTIASDLLQSRSSSALRSFIHMVIALAVLDLFNLGLALVAQGFGKLESTSFAFSASWIDIPTSASDYFHTNVFSLLHSLSQCGSVVLVLDFVNLGFAFCLRSVARADFSSKPFRIAEGMKLVKYVFSLAILPLQTDKKVWKIAIYFSI